VVSDLRTDPLPFDPVAFRPLAEKLKFYEALPDARVAELCEARYSATRPIERILAEPVRAAVLGG
jgi:hypothetical protein